MIKILMIASEPSADKLGACLIEGLFEELGSNEKIILQGLGGPLMIRNGLISLYDINDLSVMGFAEILPKLFVALNIIGKISKYAVTWKPDLIITIDSPDFSLKISKKIKKLWPKARTIHYVAPSVWAWRSGRSRKMAAFVDHVLALLPFEPEYMRSAGMSCDFVGHPIVSEKVPTNQDISLFRSSLNLDRESPMVAILPGSRKSEIKRMLPIYIKMMEIISIKYQNLVFVIPSNKNVSKLVSQHIKGTRLSIIHIREQENPFEFESKKKTLFATSLAAVATSGTVSLELARMGAPMVIAYRASIFTEIILKLFVSLNSANLINILTRRNDVPELLFSQCNAKNLGTALTSLLLDKKSVDVQRQAANEALNLLGLGGLDPKIRSARSVLRFLNL